MRNVTRRPSRSIGERRGVFLQGDGNKIHAVDIGVFDLLHKGFHNPDAQVLQVVPGNAVLVFGEGIPFSAAVLDPHGHLFMAEHNDMDVDI